MALCYRQQEERQATRAKSFLLITDCQLILQQKFQSTFLNSWTAFACIAPSKTSKVQLHTNNIWTLLCATNMIIIFTHFILQTACGQSLTFAKRVWIFFPNFFWTQLFAPLTRTCDFCILLFSHCSQTYFGTWGLQKEEENCGSSKITGLWISFFDCLTMQPGLSALKQGVIFALSRYTVRVVWLQATMYHSLSPRNIRR